MSETTSYTKEEIVNALKVIKGVCTEHTRKCNDCPLHNEAEGGCGVTRTEYPEKWIINELQEVWRALK